jgi:hypothetical protein
LRPAGVRRSQFALAPADRMVESLQTNEIEIDLRPVTGLAYAAARPVAIRELCGYVALHPSPSRRKAGRLSHAGASGGAFRGLLTFPRSILD